MSSTHDDVPGGTPVENPNADVIRGLREAADFLEAHPEVPAMEHGGAYRFIAGYKKDSDLAREMMTALAQALGDRAEERRRSDDVHIRGEFAGGIAVYISAPVALLRGEPIEPLPYEPIIGERVAA